MFAFCQAGKLLSTSERSKKPLVTFGPTQPSCHSSPDASSTSSEIRIVSFLLGTVPGRNSSRTVLFDADAADLVQDLSDETRAELLALMERDEADELGELLRYPEDTAGGTMTTEFVAVPADLSAAATIDRLRELEPDAETIYYVYVVDAAERLVGVLSLRDLIVAPPASPVGEVMIPEPVAVDVLADRDEVAAVVARYNLLAVPVVDEEHRLVGIVTVDDAMDTILPAGWRRRLPRPVGRG